MSDPVLDKSLAIGFSLLILGVGDAARRAVGTWLHPAPLFALFWFGYTFLPLTIMIAEPVNPWAIGFILCAVAAFCLSGTLGFPWARALELNRRKTGAAATFDTGFLFWVTVLSAATSLACSIVNLQIQGFSVEELLTQTVQTAAAYSNARGNELLTPNLAAKIGMGFAYLAATVGGLVFGASPSRSRRWTALAAAFLPAIASLLFESAKGLLFQFIALFLGCLLVTRIFEGRLVLMDRATLRRSVLALAVVIPLTGLSFLSRGLFGETDSDAIYEGLMRYFASYAFGHLYAFSDWFAARAGMFATQTYAPDGPGFGYYTLNPLFTTTGLQPPLPPGVFEEVYMGGPLITSNIYTMFRGLIADFGFSGALLFMYGFGLAVHAAFHALLVDRRPVLTVALFIYVIGFFYSSAFVSLLMYNVIPLNILALTLVLGLNLVIGGLTARTPGASAAALAASGA